MLRIDPASLRFYVDEKEVYLTAYEYRIMALFMSRPDALLTRRQIIDECWPDNIAVTERVVDSHINQLRKKLGRHRGCIKAWHGMGYRYGHKD